MTAVPPRIRWAVDLLAAEPAEDILEIGCGPGVAAALLCPQLTTGHLLALDRSAVAVQRTARRNGEHVASGRLTVRQGDLAALEPAPDSLDTAFAVDVNLFWTRDPGPELEVLSRALRPGGRLLVLYGTGPASSRRVTGPVADALRSHGFDEVTEVSADAGTGVTGRRGARRAGVRTAPHGVRYHRTPSG